MAMAEALPFLDPSHASLSLITPAGTNLSGNFPNLPDKNFLISANYRGVVLPDTACMMVSVFAMRELALLDLDDILLSKTWKMDEYPQVALSVGNAGDSLSVRWTMFTVTLAIRDMMTRNRYETSQFISTFHGIKVGEAHFLPTNAIDTRAVNETTEYAVPQLSGGASTASSSMASTAVDIDHANLNASFNDDDIRADLTYRTKEISKVDMFMAIIWTLLNVAPHGVDERIVVTSNNCAAITASVTTRFLRARGCPARLQLQYGNLASLIAKLPQVLLQGNVFREMDIVARESGVVVGKGTIRSADLSGSMWVPLTSSVSIA